MVDIRATVDGQSQTDPQFKNKRLYNRLSAPEVRHQLIAKFGYRDEALPTPTTIATKLNQLGYYPTKVAKSKPKKSSRPPMPSSSSDAWAMWQPGATHRKGPCLCRPNAPRGA